MPSGRVHCLGWGQSGLLSGEPALQETWLLVTAVAVPEGRDHLS